MKFKIGFGDGVRMLNIPDGNVLQVLHANEVSYDLTGEEEVRRALAEPIGTPRLRDIVRPGEKIVISTSDITRPMPTYTVMPALLDELYEAGVQPGDITLAFALGSHRIMTSEEMQRLAGERAWNEIRCVNSDVEDCVHMGDTSAGTPVDITRVVAEADRRIGLGNIEYHYFAGYSGGAKAIMPGASTPAAIRWNHSMMVDERACAGNLADNPVRRDLEEGERMCPMDFILNVVLDEEKRIIRAVAGDATEAHREGCRFLDRLYSVAIPERADIVVVSQGGAPKDLNLYQTQKALDNSKHAIKDGGTIVLAGACREGLGNPRFEEWMTEAERPEDLITRIREHFELGGHKAAAIAMIMQRANIKLVSEMDPELVRSIFFEPYDDLQAAFDDALREQGPDAKVIVMPHGGSTLPRVVE